MLQQGLPNLERNGTDTCLFLNPNEYTQRNVFVIDVSFTKSVLHVMREEGTQVLEEGCLFYLAPGEKTSRKPQGQDQLTILVPETEGWTLNSVLCTRLLLTRNKESVLISSRGSQSPESNLSQSSQSPFPLQTSVLPGLQSRVGFSGPRW